MIIRKTLLFAAVPVALLTLITMRASAGFSGTDLILPATGKVIGAGGTEFVTTGWVTNLGDHPVDVQYQFLQAGQANTNPLTVSDTLDAGETKTYEDMTSSIFHLSQVLGAVRVRSSDPVLVSARIYSRVPGVQSLANTNGVSFAGIPSARFGSFDSMSLEYPTEKTAGTIFR
jgi:hypothetical protein